MVNGRKMPIMPIDKTPETQFIRAKLRSRNSANGTSGSRSCVRAWTTRNIASRTTPAPMTSGIEMKEVMWPQLYFWPSTSP